MSKQAATEATTSKSVKKMLKAFAAEELAKLPEYVDKLEPAERVRFLSSILPYITPKVEGDNMWDWD
jgi:hypothetical protein